MDRILYINMNDLSFRWELVSAEYNLLGGRALTSRIVYERVNGNCDPLGGENILVIAPGLLGGTSFPCSGRLSIGAKSPLTGTIKESNAGGTTATRLARSGIRALVVEGQPSAGSLYTVIIDNDEVSFVNAASYRGMGNYVLVRELRREYGEAAALITIGPAGEMLLPAACIANIDMEGRPSRVNGRGGLGAVMGSKGIKAIVVKKVSGNARVKESVAFKRQAVAASKAIMNNPVTEVYTKFGTAALVQKTNAMGCLPTRNFSAGSFEGAARISGETLRDLIMNRGGKGETSHSCMPGCVIRCSNVVPGIDGDELVAPLEYETIGLMGANCGIDDLDAIARLNYLCNELGIDTIETGAAVAIAMEAGAIPWGDAVAVEKALAGMNRGEALGVWLGRGAIATGQALGVSRIPAVKGQAMPAYDPRALKGLGVTYATSPMGADHTAGTTLRAPVDHLKPDGQVEASRNAQINMALFDTLGLCMFTVVSLAGSPELMAAAVSARLGREIGVEDLRKLARQTLTIERKFNKGAGVTEDGLPMYFTKEALSPHGVVFDVEQNQINTIFADLEQA